MRIRHLRRPSRRPSRRFGGLWRWLGLGALGLTVAALLRGQRRTGDRYRHHETKEGPETSTSLPLEPPVEPEEYRVAGASGPLRVLECHPRGAVSIVFVHGLGGAAEQWSAQLAAVGESVRAVAYDLPGHGASPADEASDHSLNAAVESLATVVDALHLKSPLIVGHGFGASVAAEYAAAHPQRAAGLVLVDPPGDQSRVPPAQRLQFLASLRRDPQSETAWHFRQILRGAHPEVADRVLEHLSRVSDEVLMGGFESVADYNPLPALQTYPGPVRCVISDLNTLAYSLHRLLPEMPLRQISGASHWLMMDRPDELWDALVDSLEEIYVGSTAKDLQS